MSRIIIVGDIHGSYKALKQCLERSNFDYENDTMIQLGDIVDGWNETYEVVEELLKIKNIICCKGNHDEWYKEWLKYSIHPVSWMQGGQGTLDSYCRNLGKTYSPKYSGYITNLLNTDIPQTHIDFFNRQVKYYKDESNNLFVHGGFNRHYLLNNQPEEEIFWWDRDLWLQALSVKAGIGFEGHEPVKLKFKEEFKEIFIGHTATTNWRSKEELSKNGLIISSKGEPIDYPMNACNIWNLDQGCGFRGKLTFMNLSTKEYWQSDEVSELHKDFKGRN